MKVVSRVSRVDVAKCTACGQCEIHCPTRAIVVARPKVGDGEGEMKPRAVVDPAKCVDCGMCVEFCDFGAVRMVPLAEPRPLQVEADPGEYDRILEICRKAHLYPLEIICTCAMTSAQEVVAAVLRGAKTPEELSLVTGVRSGCGGIYCISRILRIFHAAGVVLDSAKRGMWVAPNVDIWNLPEEIVKSHSLFHIEEDRKVYFREHVLATKEKAWGLKKEGE